MATIGTVLDGQHMPPTDMAETVTIAKSDLCVGQLQSARMKDETGFLTMLEVFDTEVRKDVRRQLKKLIAEEERKIFVTGPGGTGKSFNLARFVMEMRAEGHVVAYVPTMDNVIDSPATLVDELIHAIGIAASRRAANEILKRSLLDLQAKLKVLQYGGASASTTRKKIQAVHKAYELTAQCCCSAGRWSSPNQSDPPTDFSFPMRFIAVMDQDNLWKYSKQGRAERLFASLLKLTISTLPCQRVLCASANNEGWERRNWPVHVYHGVDRVPAAYLKNLNPWLTAEQWDMLEEEYAGYPLPTIAASQRLCRGTHIDSADIGRVLLERNVQIRRDVDAFFTRRKNRAAIVNTALHLDRDLMAVTARAFDKRYSFVSNTGALRSIFPRAALELTACSVEALSNSIFALDRASATPRKYELFFIIAASRLLTSVRNVLERNNILAAVPCRRDIDGVSSSTILVPPPRAQFADAYLICKRRTGAGQILCDAFIFQVTENKEHALSHRNFASEEMRFLHSKTMLQVLRNNGVTGDIYYVYVTSFPERLGVATALWCESFDTVGCRHVASGKIRLPFPVRGTPIELLFESSRSALVYREPRNAVGFTAVVQLQLLLDTLIMNCVQSPSKKGRATSPRRRLK